MQNEPEESQTSLDLLSIGDASEYLNVSIDTLRRWEKKGRIEALRSPGGHRYFKKSELDQVFGTKYTRVEETKKYKKKKIIRAEVLREVPKTDVAPATTASPKKDQEDSAVPKFVTEEVREIRIPPNVPVAISTPQQSIPPNVSQNSSSNILIPQIQTQSRSNNVTPPATASIPQSQPAPVERAPQPAVQVQNQPIKQKDNSTIIIAIVTLVSTLILTGVIIYFYSKSQILSPVP